MRPAEEKGEVKGREKKTKRRRKVERGLSPEANKGKRALNPAVVLGLRSVASPSPLLLLLVYQMPVCLSKLGRLIAMPITAQETSGCTQSWAYPTGTGLSS